jgi:hypothetical protein
MTTSFSGKHILYRISEDKYLFGYIDGSIPKPSKIIFVTHPETYVVSECPNPTYSQWIRQDNLILSTLMTSMSKPILA